MKSCYAQKASGIRAQAVFCMYSKCLYLVPIVNSTIWFQIQPQTQIHLLSFNSNCWRFCFSSLEGVSKNVFYIAESRKFIFSDFCLALVACKKNLWSWRSILFLSHIHSSRKHSTGVRCAYGTTAIIDFISRAFQMHDFWSSFQHDKNFEICWFTKVCSYLFCKSKVL